MSHTPTDEEHSPETATSTKRPDFGRHDTEGLLSYYQSSLADVGPGSPEKVKPRMHKHQVSSSSTSSSEYSSESTSATSEKPTEALANQRTNLPSQGAGDRRRLVLISLNEQTSSQRSSSVRSRRGLESDLYLVAPPDLQPDSAVSFAALSTAPIVSSRMNDALSAQQKNHQRSASEAKTKTLQPKSSRDVGIVGADMSSQQPTPKTAMQTIISPNTRDLLPPIFQTPTTRSPIPMDGQLSPFIGDVTSPIITPEIGQGKDIHKPVAGPIVMNLSMNSHQDQFSPSDITSYLTYQPGMHARAGPLPSIQSSFTPPPRPPRSASPSRRRMDLKLPDSVTAKLASRSFAHLETSSKRTSTSSVSSFQPIDHRREGAFAPSVLISTSPDSVSIEVASVVDTPISETLEEPSEKDLRSRFSLSPELPRAPTPSSNRPSIDTTEEKPSPPPKNTRNSAAEQHLKRFSSLPRTPIIHSQLPPTKRPPRRRIKAHWPAAMFCQDILSRKTPLERGVGYANKINELYMYDCGLGDWLAYAHAQGLKPTRKMTSVPSRPSTSAAPNQQPRHVSQESAMSDVSFPRRPDATVATEIFSKSTAITADPPVLPYPSLAQSQRTMPSRASTTLAPPTSLRTLTSTTPTKSTGFFASLGRKTSVRKDKTPTNSAPSTRLVKTPIGNKPIIHIPTAPSVPGGPRAPNRALRSQTIMVSSPFNSQVSLDRRPSLRGMHSDTVIDIQADPEFARQVDKLAVLLPHADRGVLAGYLRRYGQDILAIGKYLEDEKNGCLQH